jgi:hypothetical protein
VAITGTKGKSTTAALTASILRAGGGHVALIGNIGVPVTDMYGAAERADAYVVEVSSYQAAEVTVTPGVCVLTSLAPDHLDWHRRRRGLLPRQAAPHRGGTPPGRSPSTPPATRRSDAPGATPTAPCSGPGAGCG